SMRSSIPATTQRVAVAVGGRSPLVRSEERLPLAFLGSAAAAICLLLALAVVVPYEPSPAALGEGAILAATVAAAAALWSLASSGVAWAGTKWAAWAASAAAALQLSLWLNRFWNDWPKEGG